MDPEIVAVLLAAYRQAVASLPEGQQTKDKRAALAADLVALAGAGERNPYKLIAAALASVAGAAPAPALSNRRLRPSETKRDHYASSRSRPRARYAARPIDPAGILRQIRATRALMIELHHGVGYNSPYFARAREIIAGIDGLAELLTGRRDYFWSLGGSATNGQLAAEGKWRAVEAGEIPWEWPDDMQR